jgi:serine/threonine protein kinase
MIRRTHSTAEPAPILGETVGPYRILGVLGDGRRGHLYVAEQSEVRGAPRVVALRHLHPELAGSPRFRAEFQEVVRVAARSVHPNLVSVFELIGADAQRADGRCFLGMEYLPGENVESILRRCSSGDAMPADIAAYVVKQAAAGLQCWRDVREASPGDADVPDDEVRPSDVFVTYHGTVKWLALGPRTSVDEASGGDDGWGPAGLSRSTSERGPATLAVSDDARRDRGVSSLGRLLWTCLAGKRPPASAATFGTPASRAELSPLPPGVPEVLKIVIERALSLDPPDRFDGPGAMADELDRYLFQRPSRPTPRQLRRWLEQVFGADRALLQLRVVRGRDVQAALSHLGAMLPAGGPAKSLRAFSSPRPRELWSARQSTFSQFGRASMPGSRSFDRVVGSAPDGFSRVSVIPLSQPSLGVEPSPSTLGSAELPVRSTVRERPSRLAWAVATLAACAGLALVALMLFPQPHEGARLAAPGQGAVADVSHGVSVRSTPDGAAVFIDGEPTGLVTPTVVRGLVAGRKIRVRVEKAGYQSREQSIEVLAGSMAEGAFELLASTGQVRFIGIPADARVYVDDGAVALLDGMALALPVGSHGVRVETSSALLFSGTVDVVPGEQTIRIGSERGP